VPIQHRRADQACRDAPRPPERCAGGARSRWRSGARGLSGWP